MDSASGHHPLFSRHTVSPKLLRFCSCKSVKLLILSARKAHLGAFQGLSAYLVQQVGGLVFSVGIGHPVGVEAAKRRPRNGPSRCECRNARTASKLLKLSDGATDRNPPMAPRLSVRRQAEAFGAGQLSSHFAWRGPPGACVSIACGALPSSLRPCPRLSQDTKPLSAASRCSTSFQMRKSVASEFMKTIVGRPASGRRRWWSVAPLMRANSMRIRPSAFHQAASCAFALRCGTAHSARHNLHRRRAARRFRK